MLLSIPNLRKLSRILFISFAFILVVSSIQGQATRQPEGVDDILLGMKKLNFLGSVLYVAAHPDDENTRLIAYLENVRYARTGYLALTRGDGGQNLIGPEIREALGVIRTQELLAARRIDGGEQFFTRANDFGYSKTADETLKIWDEDKVLSDVIRIYRQFRPDVIITRFPPDERAGHGHHTTSAILAQKAFDLSADPSSNPEQLTSLDPWQPLRLFTNTGRWWNPSMTGDEEGVLTVDVGTYNPLLGISMTEMAAQSRSQHKSQGFGSSSSRGQEPEFLEFVKGKTPRSSLFDGVDTTWSRVNGGNTIGPMVTDMIDHFDPFDPVASLPALLDIRMKINSLKDPYWKSVKLAETDHLIHEVTGLFIAAHNDQWGVSPGDSLRVRWEIINRTESDIRLSSIRLLDMDTIINQPLKNNINWTINQTVQLPVSYPYSQPYWLRDRGTTGMYTVTDPAMIGKAENDPAVMAEVSLAFGDQSIVYSVPINYSWTDPVNGEQRRPLVIEPPVSVMIDEPVYLMTPGNTRMISVEVENHAANQPVTLTLVVPDHWKVTPASILLKDLSPGDHRKIEFELTSPKQSTDGEIRAVVDENGMAFDRSREIIDYPHIPTQVMLPKASARVVSTELQIAGENVGYIEGAGDAIPATLEEVGYKVTLLNAANLPQTDLDQYDAIVLGIRALNTNEALAGNMSFLLEYVHRGGTLLVQYNTSHRLLTNSFSPYPLELSRDRVTEEDSHVTFLKSNHPLLNFPNQITEKDFDGWVQERGLYFPNKWDEHFTPVIASHDTGEKDLAGGVLVAEYGKGYYIYSGYSWFRELPAGVPGAIRLFVNLLSIGQNPTHQRVQK